MDLEDPTTVALIAADALTRAGLPYALYGGLLTAVYGEPRETRDADLAVIDLSPATGRDALAGRGVTTVVTFSDVQFGGLVVSRLTVLAGGSHTGLNTIDLVRPRSGRYASVAVHRAAETSLRGQSIRVLALEDYVLFKVLSTRDRDLEDAREALRRNATIIETDLLLHEVGTLARELPDIDVQGRWAAIHAPR
jgi:hypothetical protein